MQIQPAVGSHKNEAKALCTVRSEEAIVAPAMDQTDSDGNVRAIK